MNRQGDEMFACSNSLCKAQTSYGKANQGSTDLDGTTEEATSKASCSPITFFRTRMLQARMECRIADLHFFLDNRNLIL